MHYFPEQSSQTNQINKFQTPKKGPTKSHIKELQFSTANAGQESLMKSPQSINMSLQSGNMFRKQPLKKSCKNTAISHLNKQKNRLNQIIANQGLQNQVVFQQLQSLYIIFGRIKQIQDQRKFYIMTVQDQSGNQSQLYFYKSNIPQKPSKIVTRKITDIDQLDFQYNSSTGQPYFKFFIAFKMIPIYQAGPELIYDQNQHQQEDVTSQLKLKSLVKVKNYEIRLFIQHFQQITDFNYLAYHEMKYIMQYVDEQQRKQEQEQQNL